MLPWLLNLFPLKPKTANRLVIFLALVAFFIWTFPPCFIFATEKIDINIASLAQLDQLEGIGSAYAQRIIDGRPYSSLDDLLRVKGIGPTTLQKIKDQGLACVNCGTTITGTPSPSNSSSPSLNTSPSPAPLTSATPSVAAKTFDYSKDILINEFLPAPSDGQKEWVELFNAGSSVISLAGWQIDDADNSTSPQIIPENTVIYANGLLVISFNKSTLNNDGDKARLLWPDDQVVHAVSFDKAKPEQSVAKFSNGWLWTNQPTPGQINKKSFIAKNESVATVSVVEKIDPIEEKVTALVSPAPNKSIPTPQIATTPTPLAPSASQPANNQESIKLSATISEPAKESSKASSILSLAGVILLAGLTSSALIYFRRQKQIDIEGMAD